MKIKTLAQQLLFNTVRIETFDREQKPVGVGTSFILSHHLGGYGEELFLVTNKHVVENAWTAYMYFTNMKDDKPDIGNPFFIKFDFFEIGCHGHPNEEVDITVTPIGWMLDMIGVDGVSAFLKKITSDVILRPDQTEEFDAVEDVIFVGYPNGLYDRKNYIPIIRRGTTATPVQLDYDGRPVFLIDASVFGGSSGSPVFRINPSWDRSIITKLELLGVVSEVFYRTETGQFELRPAPTSVVPVIETHEMLDLGVVFKGHLILEVLDDFWSKHKDKTDELIKHREAIRKRHEKDITKNKIT
jgi:hypothetical protein